MRKLVWLVLFLLGARAEAEPVLIDRIAAVVNGEAITCSEVFHTAEELARAAGVNDARPLVDRALEALIQRRLELDEAKRLKLEVGDEELEQTIANIEEQNGLPPGGLKAALAAQGIRWEQYQQRLREQLLIGKLLNVAVRAQIKIPEEVLKSYYERHFAHPRPLRAIKVRRIVRTLPPGPSPEEVEQTRRLLSELAERARRGEPFARLARLYSQAPDAEDGGAIGWLQEGTVSPRLKVLFELPKGAISAPIRTPGGMQIFLIEDAREIPPPPRGEAYDEVRVRHILLRVPSDADAKTRAKIQRRAEKLAEELAHADEATFAQRAVELSQGPNADKGGDLGWIRRGQLLPELEEVAFRLKPGETSGVIRSPAGLHIIRVVARRHVDPNSFEARRAAIERALVEATVPERTAQWLSELRARASIEVRGCQGVVAAIPASQTKP